MLSSAQLVLFFRAVTVAANLLTAVRLFYFGLYKRFPVFVSFLVFSTARDIYMLPLALDSRTYFFAWMFTEPVIWLFYILLPQELYSLVLRQYQGIRTLAHWATLLALALSILVSAVAFLASRRAAFSPSELVRGFVYAERSLTCVLAVFLILLMLMVVHYPIPLNRNVKLYSLLYFCYFMSTAVAFFLLDLAGRGASALSNLLLTGFGAACSVAWMLSIDRRGETWEPTPVFAGQPDEARLVAQLTEINGFLTSVLRK